MNQLDFEQSPKYVSINDELVFTTDTEDYGGSPTSIVQTAINLTTGKDVTANIISGSPSVSGDIITWASVSGFIYGQMYGILMKFTCGDNTYMRREVLKVILNG